MVVLFSRAPLGCKGRDESPSLSFPFVFNTYRRLLVVRELRREVFPSLAPSLEKKNEMSCKSNKSAIHVSILRNWVTSRTAFQFPTV